MALGVSFSPNIPAQLALAKTDPEPSGPAHQWRYSLMDGRDLVVSRELSVAINRLDLSPGELFWICKRWDGDAAHRIEWDIWRDPAAERERAAAEVRAAAGWPDLKPAAAAAASSLVPVVSPSPGKIPLNVAVRELVGIVAGSLAEAGEQWADAAKQDLVSTCLIQMGKQGYLTLWERS